MRPFRSVAAIFCVLLLAIGLAPAWCAGMRPMNHACCAEADAPMPAMAGEQCPPAAEATAARAHVIPQHPAASRCDCLQPERPEAASAPTIAIDRAVLPAVWTFGDPLFHDRARPGAPPPPLPRSSRRQTPTPLRL